MKTSNKIVIAGAIICAFCLGFLCSVFVRVTKLNTLQKNTGNNYDSVETENNLSMPVKDKSNKESYLIKLEGSEIYAYVNFSDGKSVLWNSTSVPPCLSQKDKQALKEGITTTSFEEFCLYFESYLS